MHEARSYTRHIIKGEIIFKDGSKLSFLEYIVIENNELNRISCRFNYIDKNGNLIYRYDNAPHHPEIPTFPHHKHLSNGHVIAAREPSLPDILKEILELFISKHRRYNNE